jgi:peroxiredoxin
MPAPELTDLKGKSRDPQELAGSNATVVVLWQGAGTRTRMLLADLGPDVLETFGGSGVNVIGVSVKQDVATTEQQLAAAKASFPVLLDADGAASAQVGKGKLPRVYVVNSEGRVVWFDIEYSRATRRELRQTLEALTK